MELNGMLNHLKQWGDKESYKRLRSSDKSRDVQISEVENILSDIAMRFERSPNQNTTKLWARDLIESGYSSEIVNQVCKSVPFKFSKHPSLAELMELLRPYSYSIKEEEDELNRLTVVCLPHLRDKFNKLLGPEKMPLMVAFYQKHVMPELSMFSPDMTEMCILCDWARSYFGDATAIVKQGLVSNTGDREYFLRHLRTYARENSLL